MPLSTFVALMNFEMKRVTSVVASTRKGDIVVFIELKAAYFYSIYIPWPFPPVWGVADNTKETTKTKGVSLRSSSMLKAAYL